MKPGPFAYVRPLDVESAVQALAEAGDEGKVLAGGQSLIPAMNFRLARPSVLVDITRIDELKRIDIDGDVVSIGAGVTQRRVELDADLKAACQGLGKALHFVGHVQNRSQGTVCGSVAHADPASELPALTLALGGHINARSTAGSRRIAADEFFEGPFWTAVADDEIVVSVELPKDRPSTIVVVDEIARSSGDFALAGVVLRLDLHDDDILRGVRAVAFGVAGTPVRLPSVEAVLEGCHPTDAAIADASAAAHDALVDPTTDAQGDGEFRRDVVAALTQRSLVRALNGRHAVAPAGDHS